MNSKAVNIVWLKRDLRSQDHEPLLMAECAGSFLKALPIDFERKEAVSVAKGIGIPQRSADNYLKILVQQGKIIKQTHGSYRKYN